MYTEHLEQYFTANSIGPSQAEQQQAILLKVCGPTAYQLIGSHISPAKPSEKTYKQIVKLMQEHQQPTPSFTVQIFNFHTRMEQPGESISDFVAQVQKLSKHC